MEAKVEIKVQRTHLTYAASPERLNADDLDSWLDELQTNIEGKVIQLVYMAKLAKLE